MPRKDRDAQNAYAREWYKKNRSKHLRCVRRRRDEVRRAIKEAKNVPCTDCGLHFPHYVMDFHHVRGKRSFGLNTAHYITGWRKIQAEMKKCDIVCANCHRIRHHKDNGKDI